MKLLKYSLLLLSLNVCIHSSQASSFQDYLEEEVMRSRENNNAPLPEPEIIPVERRVSISDIFYNADDYQKEKMIRDQLVKYKDRSREEKLALVGNDLLITQAVLKRWLGILGIKL